MGIDQIAKRRIDTLFSLAREFYPKDKILSKRYVSLARKIAMRHRLSLGSKSFCKKCNTIFIPGTTLKVRVSPSKTAVLYTCNICKTAAKFPYSKEKRAKKGKKA